MNFQSLPTELLTSIVANHLPQDISLEQYLRLRLLNRRFNEIILYALFDLDVCRLHFYANIEAFQKNELFVYRFWRAFFQPRRRLSLLKEPKGHIEGESTASMFRRVMGEDKVHQRRLLSILQSVVQQLRTHVDSSDPAFWHTASKDPLLTGDHPVMEKCIYVLCRAAICVYGLAYAWDLLGINVEADDRWRDAPDDPFIPSYHHETWLLYAAAYLNDLERVKVILEPMKITVTNSALWRRCLSSNYLYFVHPARRRRMTLAEQADVRPAASIREQRWVTAVGSALVIAATNGCTDIVSCLLRLEPRLPRNAFRTHLHRTSARSGMGQAILNNQKEVFHLLLHLKWPLVTSTGFARVNYYNALRTALENAHHGVHDGSILGTLLNMTYDWRCPRILNIMLHHAARQNNIELGRFVLYHRATSPAKMLTYFKIEDQGPSWSLGCSSYKYALETAAYYGHVEFVKFLLEYQCFPGEVGDEARSCAMETLTCDVPRMTESHFEVLECILYDTDGSSLERALIEAVVKRDTKFLGPLLRRININQKTRLSRSEDLNVCGIDPDCVAVSQGSLHPDNRATLGELLLAMTLFALKFNNARMLIEQHGVRLIHYTIKRTCCAAHWPRIELLGFKTLCETNNIHVIDTGSLDSIPQDAQHLIFEPKVYVNTNQMDSSS